MRQADKELGRRALSEARASLTNLGGLVAGTFRHIGGKGPVDDHKEWARILRVKHESGEPLSLTQIAAYRGALGL